MEVCKELASTSAGVASHHHCSSTVTSATGRSEVVTSSCQEVGVVTRSRKRRADAAGMEQPPPAVKPRHHGPPAAHYDFGAGKPAEGKQCGSWVMDDSCVPSPASAAMSEPESSVLTSSSNRRPGSGSARLPTQIKCELPPAALGDESQTPGSTRASCITSDAGLASVSRPNSAQQTKEEGADECDQELCLLADEGFEDTPPQHPPARGAPARQQGYGEAAAVPDAWSSSSIEMCDDLVFLRAREGNNPACLDFFASKQRDLTPQHRSLMVNWLVEFVSEYNLQQETLFRAVAIMDRCLHDGPYIRRQCLQILGMACLLIAAKLEETSSPSLIPEFCDLVDCSQDDIIAMERAVLNTLSFRCSFPTSLDFLWRYLRAVDATKEQEKMAEFLASLALMDYSMLRYQPSMVAASCVFLANHTLDWDPWSATLQHLSGYSGADIRNCVERLHSQHVDQSGLFVELSAVKDKYWLPDKGQVAGIVPKASLPSVFE